MKKLYIFLVCLALLATPVLSDGKNIGGATSDDHAHWESGSYDTLTCIEGGTAVVDDLDDYCYTRVDGYTGNYNEPGCADGDGSYEYDIDIPSSDSSFYSYSITNGAGDGNVKLTISCLKATNGQKNFEIGGYPENVGNSFSEDKSSRYGYKSFKITVNPGERSPTSENVRVDIGRDEVKTFSESDFVFNDQNSEDKFSKVKIMFFNKDTLTYNNQPIEDNSLDILVSDLSLLKFTPDKDFTPSYQTMFYFHVFSDDGIMSDTSYRYDYKIIQTPRTITFNSIPAKNLDQDFPTEAIDLSSYCPIGNYIEIISQTDSELFEDVQINNKIMYIESSPTKFGQNVLTLSCSDSVSDPDDQTITINVRNTYDAIELSNQRATSLTLNEGGTIEKILPITNIDNTQLSITSASTPRSGQLEFIAQEDGTAKVKFTSDGTTNTDILPGGVETLSYQATDGTTTITGNLIVRVTNVNDRPTTSDYTIELNEDSEYTFSDNEFLFLDEDPGDIFFGIQIESLPQDGTLKLNGESINPYRIITKTELISGKLKFIPESNDNGEGYTFFYFSVIDSSNSYSDAGKITVDVDPINDAPKLISINHPNFNTATNTVTILEDSDRNVIFLEVEDIDGDDLVYGIQSNDEIVVKSSNIKLFSSGDRPRIELAPEEDISDMTTQIVIYADDKNGGYSSFNFNVAVDPINDAPISENFTKTDYIYSTINFQNSDFKFFDADIKQPELSTITEIRIVHIPDKGALKYNGNLISSIYSINPSQIDKLSYELVGGVAGNTSFTFQVKDQSEYSELYQANVNILSSPFGDNSHPARLGGIMIPNFQYGDWSCKPGYQPVQNSVLNGYSCEVIPNGVPVANFTIYPLFEDEAIKGQSIYFKSNSYDPDYDLLSYNWSFNENGTNLESIDNFNGSICNNGICSVTLSVSDEEDSNSITKTFPYNSETDQSIIDDLEDQILDLDNLEITEGKTYTDTELASLSLVKGSSIILNNKKITVDSQGKITELKTLQSYTSTADENDRNDANNIEYIVGDGKCNKFIGENSVNSPIDCEEKSNIFGIILVLSFISILGILGFVAWKKGLFTKLSKPKTSPSITSYEVPSYTQPTTQINTKPNLSSIVRTKINEGYSEGEIKSYLIAQGYSEADIDSALNS